jgi:hypothetical protein
MMVEMFMFLEVLVVVIIGIAFFTKQEILWFLAVVVAGILMFASYDIQGYVYEYNETMGAYQPVIVSNPYIYVSYLNMIFFSLALILGLWDVWQKYGLQALPDEITEKPKMPGTDTTASATFGARYKR